MPATKIGKYQIENELGHGGMGKVYKGYDERFDRYVAIKVMPEALAREESFRQRFEREAKIIATLQHPGIVPVHDFGEDNGRLYLVMRYMTGGSLRDRLDGNPLPIKDTAKIMHNICQALDSAHQKGIVHRDLKPGNILFDQYGHAFLADFGIARLTNATIRLTETNATIGTPAYMSPEQVRADIDVDHRSDIYSLGIILYEMLTGVVPYEAETPTKTMLMHILQPIPSIMDVRPELPYRCEQILQTALAKDKFERYDSAVEFAHDIRLLAQGRPRGKRSTGPLAQQPHSPTLPTAVIAGDGQTIDEAYIESQILSNGNDLIDDVLSYHAKDQQQRMAERAQQIRKIKRKEDAALRERKKQHELEVARRRAAQQAQQEKQRQQNLIILSVIGILLVIVILILVAISIS